MAATDTLNVDRLVTHVVAWHHRHLLALRINATRVHSVGYVGVPFQAWRDGAPVATPPPAPGSAEEAAASGSLRERAMARALQAGEGGPDLSVPLDAAIRGPAHALDPWTAADLRPVFDDDFLPPCKPEMLGRWVAEHGVALRSTRRDLPVRRIQPRSGTDPATLVWRWVLTAQVDVDGRRTRVLLGGGAQPQVLGRRLLSPLRLGLCAVAAVAVLAAGWSAQQWRVRLAQAALQTASATVPPATPSPAPTPTPAPAIAARASASAAAGPATAPSAAALLAPAPPPPSPVPSPAVALAPAAPASVARPPDVEPRLGKVSLPSLGPLVDERKRQAREQAASAPAAAVAAVVTPPTAPAARAAPEAPVLAPAFAVWTRVLRTRSESSQLAEAMRGLLAGQAPAKMRVEVMPAGDDWRVVSWPYATREQADRARELLAARGMRVEVVEF